MNYLIHLYLAEPTWESRLGALMGDFIKGPLGEEFPKGLREGIRRHRLIDRFAQESEYFRRSKRRVHDSFGICKPILIDIFYDHFMARTWEDYSSLPLERFAAQIYGILEEHHAGLPQGLQEVAPRMIVNNWLVSYREIETVELVLERISRRLNRPNPLASGFAELTTHYRELEEDFRGFLPEAESFLTEAMP